MKVFVAGASGALAGPLVKELLSRGRHVTAMAPSAGRTQRQRGTGANFIQVDAFYRELVNEAIQRWAPDIVVINSPHCPRTRRPATDISLRPEGAIGGRRESLRCGSGGGCKRYLKQSSAFTYNLGMGAWQSGKTPFCWM
jgi:hypothetical protein